MDKDSNVVIPKALELLVWTDSINIDFTLNVVKKSSKKKLIPQLEEYVGLKNPIKCRKWSHQNFVDRRKNVKA